MQHTTINWVVNPDGTTPGYSWSPVTGCLNHHEGLCLGGNFPCYAYRLANTRLREVYLRGELPSGLLADDGYWRDPFYPRFWPDRFAELRGYAFTVPLEEAEKYFPRQPGKGIFVSDMGDMFGRGVPERWTSCVLTAIRNSNPRNRYYLLTKQPQNLSKFSPFPDNCWVGVSATDTRMALTACVALKNIEATVKYLSIEPMLHPINLPAKFLTDCGISWVILGAQTKPSLLPEVRWVEEVEHSVQCAGVKLYEKDSLKPLLDWALQREWPK